MSKYTPETSRAGIDAIRTDKDIDDTRLRDELLIAHMTAVLRDVGELVEVRAGGEGRVPAFLNSESGKLTLMTPGNRDAIQLLKHWFGWPAHWRWEEKIAMDLDGSGLPQRELHTLSFYDAAAHVLYLNEWGGTHLRIDGAGTITRHTNGANGVLFAEAPERSHKTDLEAAAQYTGPAWGLDDGSALVRHIFDVVTFDESIGVDRKSAHGILMGFLLAVLFRERVMSLPIIHLHSGQSGTKKTALAVAIGWLLFGLVFKATACPEDKKEAENVLLNSPGYVVLDESNKMYLLQDMLKAIVTGAYLRRRKYFTTAQEEEYPVRTAVVLTTNSLSITEDALTARIFQLILTGGDREWKSEFQIAEEWRVGNLREILWTELVGRAASAMREISEAKRTGNEHLTVAHRMSSFWVFLKMLARQEGREDDLLSTIESVSQLQTSTMESQDDLAPLFEKIREGGRIPVGSGGPPPNRLDWMTAAEWGELLKRYQPFGGLPLQLEKLVSSAARLSNRMEQSKERLGIEVQRVGRVKQFRLAKR